MFKYYCLEHEHAAMLYQHIYKTPGDNLDMLQLL